MSINTKYNYEYAKKSDSKIENYIAKGMKRKILSSDGYEISWIEFGKGIPIIISPALGTPLFSWIEAIKTLAEKHKVIFIFTRGGYEGAIPNTVSSLTVERRGLDIIELLESLNLLQYYIVAHSSGVAPVAFSLPLMKIKPLHIVFLSSRYEAGQPINAEYLIKRSKDDLGFLNIINSVIASFSPPFITKYTRDSLNEFSRLEALLIAFDYSRGFNSFENLDPNIRITFIIAEYDPDEVRISTKYIIESRKSKLSKWDLLDLKGEDHFFIQTQGTIAANLINNLLIIA